MRDDLEVGAHGWSAYDKVKSSLQTFSHFLLSRLQGTFFSFTLIYDNRR